VNNRGSIVWSETSLVLLPGLDGTGELFAPALELDWGGLRPVVRPLPALGPQDYDSLAEQIGVKLPDGELVLVAESFSSPLATLLAARHAGRVRALVLVSGFCAAPHSSRCGRLPPRPVFAVTPPNFFLRRFLTGEQAPPGLLESLSRALRQTPSATLAERVRVTLALDEQDCPDLGTLPVLLLQASQDRLLPWEVQSTLERHFPTATTEWINGPHLLMQTRAQDCRNAVIRFLATAGEPSAVVPN